MLNEGEGNQFDRVDLNLAIAHAIPTANLYLGPLPKAERDRDVARQNRGAKFPTENHDLSVRAPLERSAGTLIPRRARGDLRTCGSILRTVPKRASSFQALRRDMPPICAYRAMGSTSKGSESTSFSRGPKRVGHGTWAPMSGEARPSLKQVCHRLRPAESSMRACIRGGTMRIAWCRYSCL